ncbi:site-specific DNA-methyltransferase [Nitratireductor aquimarinus]|uniref:site-specific DNA-methyltransferase n=1 Tax=Nitratireductor TaxID=245876 RepID=UPI0019D3CD0B|nr:MULTISPECIES: site-specific DNA-methyltransferase [Nitratireductor]MBN7775937.1 site-specific DNA-methyltransferase [Nitratireductor pacificus]MBN7780600.1 site-specific DNA-methyltransferase [Nitratireductor pacificus]MBN7789407.1 site-specific DNA-methyltransferase [Nitratireductor aquimarinus]MBY6098685.1 site-specific DNA-methyltransferase [Nitratireductor aquimarinus]MCA1259571.1 site-specific DNA-methyltransferase [Nitratireductor aquimarinus]
MDKLKMHSPDLSQDNIAKIRDLFPGCVTEARDEATGAVRLAVDLDQLRQELSDHIVEGPQERYRLDWPGKREALALANAPIAKTLRPEEGESESFLSTKNILIEGDNLEALKLLQETYLGTVKMIYIDPPYNTGNDFIYSDDFVSGAGEFLEKSNQVDAQGNRLVANTQSNGRFHSDWLSMLYPRLKLAKNLLHQFGVIFISIDAGELGGLRLMCDEIFGAENFIDQLVWQKKVSPSNDSRFFSNDHELIVAYAKSKVAGVIQRQERSEKHNQYYKNPDNDPRGAWNSTAATCNKNHLERPNLYYPIKNPHTDEEIWPSKSAVWAFSQERMNMMAADGRLYWGADGTSRSPRVKNFLTEAKKVVPRNILSYQEYGNTQSATSEFNSLFPEIGFDYPKPTKLLQGIINFVARADDEPFIVMDFFAGSGTTAHAAIAQSAIDGLERQFILVQLPEVIPEKSDARSAGYETVFDITKERIRRAGKKILEGECHPDWNRDVGFRVLKVDTSNMKDVYYRPDELNQADLLDMVDNVKPDRTAEDLLFQVLVDWGVDLTLPIRRETLQGKTVFFVDDNALVACFDKGITEDLVKELAGHEPLRVVFRDNGFVSDAVKINVEQIFRQLSPTTDVKSI